MSEDQTVFSINIDNLRKRRACVSKKEDLDPEIDPEIDQSVIDTHTHDTTRHRINISGHSDAVKKRCHDLLRLYEGDPDNNNAEKSIIDLILQLPTKHVLMTIKRTYEETISFLNTAWENMGKSVYGQEVAKHEIIEYLTSNIIKQDKHPRVIGLVGPPGVGKTTLVTKGIAQVLSLPFFHLSMGGMRDVTYFSGTKTCWKGAHQGIFTDILIACGRLDPVIYIDEIDKLAVETASDIYGILTHITDPLSNNNIMDHYLNIGLDLSKVTFIFSYNDNTALPAPLKDRIKEITLNGFSIQDKIVIAKDFIIPACLNEVGLTSNDIVFSEEIIKYAHGNDDENDGVRKLKKTYQTVIGKILVRLINNRAIYEQLVGISKTKKLKSNEPKMIFLKNDPLTIPYYVKESDFLP